MTYQTPILSALVLIVGWIVPMLPATATMLPISLVGPVASPIDPIETESARFLETYRDRPPLNSHHQTGQSSPGH